MMIDEGYIKFNPVWTQTEPLPWDRLENLNYWRDVMYEHQFIGAYDNGIGFGNISLRWEDTDQFVISGSATGNFPKLNGQHYSLVTDVDIAKNTLHCQGPIVASSESMSHAVIYQECPWVNAVIHVHHLEYWQKLLHKLPTTPESVSYGSPEMAQSIVKLLRETNLQNGKLFVMAGHEEGLFAFGETLSAAAAILLELGHQ